MSVLVFSIILIIVCIDFEYKVGFPLTPLKNSYGEYNGHEFYVFERVSKPLSNIITKNTNVSRDDYLNLACQLFEILNHLFKKQLIVKNIDIHDFCLRRTTNGYRVVFLNQDFYEKYILIVTLCTMITTREEFVIDEFLFTSVSVMKQHGIFRFTIM